MSKRLPAAAVPFTALFLAGCVPQTAYDQLAAQYREVQAKNRQLSAELAQSEEKWIVAGDGLFREGGYRLSTYGEAALSRYIPKLQSLRNTTVAVYDYTDDLPVGPALQHAGIRNNLDLSSRRADNVVEYFRTQGVDPNILSAKGFGDTHPVASNATPDGRAQNRRIEIVLESHST